MELTYKSHARACCIITVLLRSALWEFNLCSGCQRRCLDPSPTSFTLIRESPGGQSSHCRRMAPFVAEANGCPEPPQLSSVGPSRGNVHNEALTRSMSVSRVVAKSCRRVLRAVITHQGIIWMSLLLRRMWSCGQRQWKCVWQSH